MIFQCGLSWTLYKVSQEHLEKPLVNFSVDLPEEWGMPLGWSLAFVPVLLIIFGFIFHLLWKSRGMPFKMVSATVLLVRCNLIALSSTIYQGELIKIYGFFQHLKRCFKPTDVWYENEHRELMALDASSPKVQATAGLPAGESYT